MADDMSGNPLEMEIESEGLPLKDLLLRINESGFLQWSSTSWFVIWGDGKQLGNLTRSEGLELLVPENSALPAKITFEHRNRA